MATIMETPVKTPQQSAGTENVLSTPLFVPPTPMLKELGYGTGMFFSRIFLFRLHISRSLHLILQTFPRIEH